MLYLAVVCVVSQWGSAQTGPAAGLCCTWQARAEQTIQSMDISMPYAQLLFVVAMARLDFVFLQLPLTDCTQ
jgi:hypothetical protein